MSFDWMGWIQDRPDRARRVQEQLDLMRQPDGINEAVTTWMLALHLLSYEERRATRELRREGQE